MDVTVSIVSYNTSYLLERLLTSIYKKVKNITFEVIVVDNASSDDSIRMVRKKFPRVKLIANKKNNFFSKANNQALKISKGKYFLILNSDTYFIDNSIKRMVDFLERNLSVGAVEGLELYEDGNILKTGSLFSTPLIDLYELSWIGKRIANKSIVNKYRMINKNRKTTYSIDVGCDAFLMVRSEIMKKIKGYDEKFLLYYTENDLCLRIKNLGFNIVHLGQAKIIHRVSASVMKLNWKRIDIYYEDLFYYYKKNGFYISGLLLFMLLKMEQFAFQAIKR